MSEERYDRTATIDTDTDTDRLYYDSSIRGYSAVIYNNKKYALIKLHKNGNIYMYYE